MAGVPIVRLHWPSQAERWWGRSRLAYFRSGMSSGQSGFALIAVIWSLGLISLLGAAIIVGARYRTKTAVNYASVATTTAAAESAINLAIALSLTRTPQLSVKFPLHCRMPGGEQVAISLEEEAGKVDLNTASPDVLSRLFGALTLDQSTGLRITQNIIEFRSQEQRQTENGHSQSSGTSPRDGNFRFTTIMQLDQINGITPRLFRAALRFVTVHSGRPEPDKDASSQSLLELLGIEHDQKALTRAPPAAGDVTIRADVTTLEGARFIREALVSFGSGEGQPFRIREWRHGDIDRSPPRRSAIEEACFQVGESSKG